MIRLRSYLANVALVVVSVAALALLAELVLRTVVPAFFRPRYTAVDPIVGWSHTPSVSAETEREGHQFVLSYNSHGYRPPEHRYEKPDGTFRIVVIGDSFVDGSEVGDEELFTWHLQQRLAVEVVNLGVYGYSTAQEFLTLEDRGLRYEPDLVVLVTISNDYTDNLVNFSLFGPAPRFVLEGEGLSLQTTRHPEAVAAFRRTNLPFPGMSFLHRNSHLYTVINRRIYQRFVADRMARMLEQQENAVTQAEQIELYRRIVHRMSGLVAGRDGKLLVVFAYLKSELATAGEPLNRRVARVLAGDGIATLDLYPQLRAAWEQQPDSLYYRQDIHWTEQGHRVVAEILATEIPRIMMSSQGPTGAPLRLSARAPS